MRIEAGEHGVVTLSELYVGVCLVSGDGTKVCICERDGGFEMSIVREPPSAKTETAETETGGGQ